MDGPALTRSEQVAREDLVMFINACFSCTGQREFYTDARGQAVSIDFLHQYILGNYRRLYARTLAAGINHFNQGQIIVNLLATGRETAPEARREEGALIATALRGLPPQRAFRVLEMLRERRVNNRRARAIMKEYLTSRPDPGFDAVKYRMKVRSIIAHGHLKLEGEIGPFLFANWKARSYKTPLFEKFRQATYAKSAIYELPYTIAEGFAAKYRIPREEFLQRIEPRLTAAERLRLQNAAARAKGVEIDIELEKAPLTKLALYLISLPVKTRIERREALVGALEGAAKRTLRFAPVRLGRVAAVLDCSYSSSGSGEKRRRPLGVALAAHYLLKHAAAEYRAFWTTPVEEPLLVGPRGQTDLATPLLDALDWKPDLVVIVSDGYENDPPLGAAEVARVFRTRIDPARRTSIVHLNPVFDSEHYAPRSLGTAVPTVGLRDGEDLPTVLGFARLAEGTAPLSELEGYLALRVRRMLERDARRRGVPLPPELAGLSLGGTGQAQLGPGAGETEEALLAPLEALYPEEGDGPEGGEEERV